MQREVVLCWETGWEVWALVAAGTKMWKGGSLIRVSENLSWNWRRAGTNCSRWLDTPGWTYVLSPNLFDFSLCSRNTQDMPGLQW